MIQQPSESERKQKHCHLSQIYTSLRIKTLLQIKAVLKQTCPSITNCVQKHFCFSFTSVLRLLKRSCFQRCDFESEPIFHAIETSSKTHFVFQHFFCDEFNPSYFCTSNLWLQLQQLVRKFVLIRSQTVY